MTRFRPWRAVTDGAYRIAVALGLASIPVTAALYWQSGNTISVSPILLSALLVGALYHDRPVPSVRAGAVTGFVGSVVVLWPYAEMLAFIAELSQPAWFGVVQVGVLTTLVAFAVVVTVLAGRASAWIGDRVARTLGRSPPSGAMS